MATGRTTTEVGYPLTEVEVNRSIQQMRDMKLTQEELAQLMARHAGGHRRSQQIIAEAARSLLVQLKKET